MAQSTRVWLPLGCCLIFSACTAEITGPLGDAPSVGASGSGSGSGGLPSADPTATPGACDASLGLAPPRLWRLNDQQYANVVHDVFGAGIAVPPDVSAARVRGSEEPSSASGLSISDLPTAQNYFRSAGTVAASAVANLGALLPCATPDATCIEAFVRTKVARAFRRPVTDEQVTDMLAIYQLGAQDGPSAGIEGLLRYVLQSPWLLWRTELPTNSSATLGPEPLDAFDLASAVSFLLLNSAPDDPLWARAVDGTITQPAVLGAEVDRLMALPSAKANLVNKVGSWLSIRKTEVTAKNPSVFPEFTPEIQASLAESVQLFLEDVVEHGTLSDLVSSHRMYLNQELATLYGIGGVASTSLVPVDVAAPQWAGGILTQPAVLAAMSRSDKGDPIHRGLFIYNSMVCGGTLPGPPPDALAIDSALPADASERDRANYRASDGKCRGCHARFDPFGLVSERYDPIGRYRETDASGKLIDQTATVNLGGGPLDGFADGIPDLVARMKSARGFSDCASGMVADVALGRAASGENSCALRAVQEAFATNGSFLSLFKAIATSPEFAARDARLEVK